MTLAPVADLGPAGGPHEDDAFSDLPGAAARSVRAAVSGYRASRVVAVPGHFPGEGAASQDPSLGAATVGLSLGQLRGRDMLPFATVAKHAAAIQLSDSLYAGFDGVTPATLLPRAVAELRRLGFSGVVVSGDLAAATLATGGTAGDAAVAALQAGCDLLWLPGSARDQEDAWRAVVRAIRSGKIRASRVTSALRRVAAMKKAYGIG
jgi:beta-N-acetylhexosaminidase